MAEKVNFELVSPEMLLLSQDVDMVVIPGAEGDFGVLAEHAPVISTVRSGTITVFDDGVASARIFVAGGFAEVTAERCTVLAEIAEPLEEIDRAEVESQLGDLRDDLGRADDDSQRQKLATAIAIAEAKLEAMDGQIYE